MRKEMLLKLLSNVSFKIFLSIFVLLFITVFNLNTLFSQDKKDKIKRFSIELIETFRLVKPYQKRGNLGAGFKSVGESIPTMPVQEFAPENAKPVTMEDYKNMESMDDKLPREPGEEDDWDDQF